MRHRSYALILALTAGCRSVYYETLDAVGVEQHEILQERVGEARELQRSLQQTLREAVADDTISPAELDRIEVDRGQLAERIDSVSDGVQLVLQEEQKELEELDGVERAAAKARLEEARKYYGDLLARLRQVDERLIALLEGARQDEPEDVRDRTGYLIEELDATIEATHAGVDRDADREWQLIASLQKGPIR